MYSKIFRQLYDGTLATKGPWQALVTFVQLLTLANRHGEVDMTAEVISRTTTIPLEIIEIGIRALMEPDPKSRSSAEEGRRIILLAPPRDWGWRIVNFAAYHKIQSEEDRRAYHRRYYHDVRKKNVETQPSQHISTVSIHTDVDVDANVKPKPTVEQKTLDRKKPVDKSKATTGDLQRAVDIARISIRYLNLKSGRSFPETRGNLALVCARILRDGATEAQIQAVIDAKVAEWGKDLKMRMFLRPMTIFGAEKWGQYVGQLTHRSKPTKRVVHIVGVSPEGVRGSIDSFMQYGPIDAVGTARRFLMSHSMLIRQKGFSSIEVQDTNEERSMIYALEELK